MRDLLLTLFLFWTISRSCLSSRSRMPPLIIILWHINILGLQEPKRPFRCNKVSSVGWIGHLPEASEGSLLSSPSLMPPWSRHHPNPSETGRARRPETVDSGFDEVCYRLPAAWRSWSPLGRKVRLRFPFVEEKGKQDASTSAEQNRAEQPICSIRIHVLRRMQGVNDQHLCCSIQRNPHRDWMLLCQLCSCFYFNVTGVNNTSFPGLCYTD